MVNDVTPFFDANMALAAQQRDELFLEVAKLRAAVEANAVELLALQQQLADAKSRTSPCVRTVLQVADFLGPTHHLTGFTGPAVAALAHLRDAWIAADPTNRPGIALAIAALLTTRSLAERPTLYLPYLEHGLDDDQRARLRVDIADAALASLGGSL